MASKIETALRRAADRDALRLGKALLTSGAVVGCFPVKGGTGLLCVVAPKDAPLVQVPLERPLSRNLQEGSRLSSEAVAAILHCERHLPQQEHHKQEGEPPPTAPSPTSTSDQSKLHPVRHVLEEAQATTPEAQLHLSSDHPRTPEAPGSASSSPPQSRTQGRCTPAIPLSSSKCASRVVFQEDLRWTCLRCRIVS